VQCDGCRLTTAGTAGGVKGNEARERLSSTYSAVLPEPAVQRNPLDDVRALCNSVKGRRTKTIAAHIRDIATPIKLAASVTTRPAKRSALRMIEG